MDRNRRRLLQAAGAAAVMSGLPASAAPRFEWTSVAPAEAGFAPDLAERLEAAIQAGRLPNLHGALIVHDGRLVLERYVAGEDESWGRPLGKVAFGPATLHDMRSVTKSVVSLLYGIALAAGKVAPPEAPLMDQFRDYPDLAADPARRRWTVAHALTMTLGTQWDEMSIPYSNPANSEIAMERAPDRYRFILDRPIVEEPGVRWIYNGGATALLGRMIARGTGRELPDYARSALFEPLGIDTFEWVRGMDGVTPSAASGLRLRPRDLARIGLMMAQGGQWQGRVVVPADWLEAALQTRVRIDEIFRYGYQWYLTNLPPVGDAKRRRLVSAIGNGGQRLFILPEAKVVVVTTFGNYNQPDQWKPPVALLRDIVLPALR
ncbi:MAG TPA: serine hydrolase [Vineibacter sp.]|nr:serine hydrolase [Vineibacter sp.]